MSVVNKRIAVFAAVALIMIGIRLFDNGLPGFIDKGVYTVFGAGDKEIVCGGVPALNARGSYERIDTPGRRQRRGGAFGKYECQSALYRAA